LSGKLASKVLADIGMAVTMFISFLTGLVLWLVLPQGRRAGQSVFLGLTRSVWSDIHTYSSFAFGAILLVHLALNWRLFLSMAKAVFRPGKKGS
jgi:hypothetical protein